MSDTISRAIRDSEEEFINRSYWDMLPIVRMIQNGDTVQLSKIAPLSAEALYQNDRIGNTKTKEIEYMAVSLVNTFMISAIEAGVYPPEANWTADYALHQIAESTPDKFPDIIRACAITLCEQVKARKMHSTGNPHVEKARKYLLTHLTQEITLEEVADHVGVSKYHLSHIFKEYAGMTIRQYLTHERIEAAKDLLETSDKTIPEIAALFQFCDQSYFTYVFRTNVGMTPGEYRASRKR